MKYQVTLYWSDNDNCFLAEVPELDGCMSDGKSYEEALQKIQLIMSEWIETARDIGREIPKPNLRN
jgi:predicted RNase H-like HicB family nuclease